LSPRLEIYQPDELAEALQILGKLGEGARVLAGGTALSIMLRQKLIGPTALVDIGRIPQLDGIEETDGGLTLGALTRHRAIERSEMIRARLPVLAEAFGLVGNVRVRNQATVGGVVAEADYASDPPTVLVGLDATIRTASLGRSRMHAAADFFRDYYTTALDPDEVIVSVEVPWTPDGLRCRYTKFVTRSAEDRPCLGVFAACRPMEHGRFADIRVVIGAATGRPQRFTDVEAPASGTDLADDICAAVAASYAARIEPIGDVRGSSSYRKEMISVMVRRTLASVRDAA